MRKILMDNFRRQLSSAVRHRDSHKRLRPGWWGWRLGAAAGRGGGWRGAGIGGGAVIGGWRWIARPRLWLRLRGIRRRLWLCRGLRWLRPAYGLRAGLCRMMGLQPLGYTTVYSLRITPRETYGLRPRRSYGYAASYGYARPASYGYAHGLFRARG